MQIAKEPLLYHLGAAAGETEDLAGLRGRAGKGTLVLWVGGRDASGESPHCQVPSKPRGSVSLLSW